MCTLLMALFFVPRGSVVPVKAETGATIPPRSQATYTVVFQSTWSDETHPHDDFPASAHFSPLIGAMHTITSSLWTPATLASAGMEQMAETGGTTQLRAEIVALGEAAQQTIRGPRLGSATGTVTITALTVERTHPAVTLVTMIAPSPDWFVGVHSLSLLDGAGNWRDEVTMTLYPYDAGTDDGTDYTDPDVEPQNHQPITALTGTYPFSDASIGTLTFIRQPEQLIYLPAVRR